MDIQKEVFEAKFKLTRIYKRESAIRSNDILEFSQSANMYFNIVVNESWRLWQEAKASAAPEGFVLMPKEPTKDTLIEIASVCIGGDFANLDEASDLYKATIKEAVEAREVS